MFYLTLSIVKISYFFRRQTVFLRCGAVNRVPGKKELIHATMVLNVLYWIEPLECAGDTSCHGGHLAALFHQVTRGNYHVPVMFTGCPARNNRQNLVWDAVGKFSRDHELYFIRIPHSCFFPGSSSYCLDPLLTCVRGVDAIRDKEEAGGVPEQIRV